MSIHARLSRQRDSFGLAGAPRAATTQSGFGAPLVSVCWAAALGGADNTIPSVDASEMIFSGTA